MEKFSVGDILAVSRSLYFHYGVYVGHGKVVHFADGMFDSCKKIRKTSLRTFEKGGKVFCMNIINRYDGKVIAERAESCIGSSWGGYNLVSNNCEMV